MIAVNVSCQDCTKKGYDVQNNRYDVHYILGQQISRAEDGTGNVQFLFTKSTCSCKSHLAAAQKYKA